VRQIKDVVVAEPFKRQSDSPFCAKTLVRNHSPAKALSFSIRLPRASFDFRVDNSINKFEQHLAT
jgi:hypothetical protein